MRKLARILAAAGLFVATGATVVTVATAAHADTQICDQYGSTTIEGRYVVQNNRWGTSAQQCINVTGTGFNIATQQGSNPTNGGPVSYPSVFYGCHYTNCSPGTVLPKQVSQISSATSGITYTYVNNAIYDASYDIWLDPTPKTDGVNQQEVMIWFNHVGAVQPVGSAVGNATIGGRSWQVWIGNNGGNNVISYVAPSAITSWNFSLLDFINDVRGRTSVTTSWYLTSVQAGFEPWQNGAGLGVSGFSVNINGGSTGGPTPTTSPTGGPTPTSSPTGGTGGSTACKVGYTLNSWSNGFTATVAVTNTGSSAVNGWTLGWSFPGNQQVTNGWNATVSQSGQAVTAKSLSYNGTLAPGASTSFGFQGTYSGSNAAPTRFTLNGSTCTTA